MTRRLDEAKNLLEKGSYTCVIAHDKDFLTSTEDGIKPLLNWFSSTEDLRGASAADKVVGKAPAFLYVLFGVSEVYGAVMSESALELLSAHGIQASYTTLVPFIQNKWQTGMCPIEQSVAEIDDPELALTAIRQQLKELAVMKK